MRNLKKLTALVLALAMVITLFMVPVVAEELTAAQKLTVLGVLKGSGDGVTEEYLAGAAKRSTAAILYLKLKGLEDEAKNFDGVENFDDAEGQSQYVKNIMAYYKANPELGFQGYNNKFNPDAVISAQEYYKVMLTALGYEQGVDFEWSEVLTFAKFVGLKLISNVTEMTVDNFAVATTEALDIEVKGTGATMIETLVADGTVADTDAAAAGWEELAEPVVVELAAIEDIAVANGGDAPTLPETVTATYDNDETADLVVTWNEDDVAAIDTSVGGTYTVEGVFAETDMTATVDVVVAADTTAPTTTKIEFTNGKVMVATFDEAVSGTPVVKVNGATVDAAKVALAEDGMSLTVTETTAYTAGAYLVMISGLVDSSDNALATTMTATKAASAITTVDVQTTGLIKYNAAVGVGLNDISYKVYDQYGEAMSTISLADLEFKLSYNSVPAMQFTSADTAATTAGVFVEAGKKDPTFVAERVIDLKVYAKDADGAYTVLVGQQSLTVEDVTLKASAISTIANSATAIKGGDTFNLTATVLDQFGNDYTLLGTEKLRWVIADNSIVKFTGALTATYLDGALGNNAIGFTAGAAGTTTVYAYTEDGTAYGQIDVTVSAGDLNAIVSVGTLNVDNKAVPTAANITINGTTATERFNFQNANNADIVVPAADVTVAITTASASNSAADISVEKVTDTSGNLTGLKVASNRTNTTTGTVAYTLTITVGTKTATMTVNSNIDDVITAISDITFNANDLPAGSNVSKAIKFYNKYGEELAVTDADIAISSGYGSLTPSEYKTDASGNFVVTTAGTDVVTAINLAAGGASVAGSYNVLVTAAQPAGTTTAGSVSKTFVVPIVAASAPVSMTLGSNTASVIISDSYNYGETSGDSTDSYLEDNAGVTHYIIPITFIDQYGKSIDVTQNTVAAAGNYQITTTGGGTVTYNYFSAIAEATDNKIATTLGASKYLAISAGALATTETITLQLQKHDGSAWVNVGTPQTVQTTVNAARALTSMTPAVSATKIVKTGTKTITFTAKDQYGVDFTFPGGSQITMQAVAGLTQGANGVGTIGVTGNTEGSYAPVFFYDVNGNGTQEATETITASVNVTVGTTAGLLTAIEFDKGTTYKYNVNVAGSTLTMPASAYNGSDMLTIPAGFFNYSLVTNALKDNNDATVGVTVNASTGAITTAALVGGATSATGTVTVRALEPTTGIYKDITYTLDTAVPVAQSGTYYISSVNVGATAADNKVTTLSLDNDNATATYYVWAVDQYGQAYDVTESSLLYGLEDANASNYVTISTTAATLVLNSVGATSSDVGTTTLRVYNGGVKIAEVTVSVVD